MAAKPQAPKLTEDNRFLLKKNGNNFMGSMLTRAIQEETRREAEKYKWTGTIKPSSLSLNMCFEKFQQELGQYKKWTLIQKLSFLYGNALHSYIGEYLVRNYPASYFAPNVPLITQNWYAKAYPEIPIRSDKWRAKAVVDYSARISGAPVIIDWKTCHYNEEDWLKFVERPWVNPNYVMQGASYCFLLGEEGYYITPPLKFGFVFINLMLEPKDEFMWKEIYYDYAPYAEVMHYLWTLAVESVEAKLAGETVPCKNHYCKTHGKEEVKRLIPEINPWKPEAPISVRQNDGLIHRSNAIFDRAEEFSAALLKGMDMDIYNEQELMEDYCISQLRM